MPTGTIPSPPKALGYRQDIRPNSTDDLLIGDHVTFWNHLAFGRPQHEAAVAVAAGKCCAHRQGRARQDLFQGTAPALRARRKQMLKDLAKVYNGYAGRRSRSPTISGTVTGNGKPSA